MRRYQALAILALALTVVPEAADARSRFSPRAVLGAATAPFRAVMRVIPGKSASRYHQRRTAATRTSARQPTRAAIRTASIERAPIDAATAGAVPVSAATAGVAPVTEVVAPIRAQRSSRAPVPASFNAYEEILGYALWPHDYAAQYWARGYGDIIKAVVSPLATAAATIDDRTERRTRLVRSGAAHGDVTGGVPTTGMCGAQAEDRAGTIIERIGQTIELTAAQRTHLRELRAALAEAVTRGKAACLAAMPATPAGRLKAAADGLWVMRDADILFRTPLADFYATLTESQKAQLSMATTAGGDRVQHNVKSGGAAAPTCSAGANDLPVDAIEQSVRPTPEQRAGLEILHGISSDMSNYLATSCPAAPPPDPVARLDTVGHRISAMLYAVMLFDQALNGFYLQLSDDQKKTFDRVGHK